MLHERHPQHTHAPGAIFVLHAHCRWVVINKDPSRAGTAVLRVNRNSGYAPKVCARTVCACIRAVCVTP